MGSVVGGLVNGLVQIATCCHDRCNNLRYTDDWSVYITDIDASGEKKPRLTSSIFVAIQDNNVTEVERHIKGGVPDEGALNGDPDHADETVQPRKNVCRASLKRGEESPMHVACRLGHHVIANCLIDNGYPVGVVTSLGSPIHSLVNAVKSGYITDVNALRLLQRLVERGCDLNARDGKGRTALYTAVLVNLHNMVKGILLLPADTNLAENENGFTALHMAVYLGSYSCVQAILKQNHINMDARDILDRTPLMVSMLAMHECLRKETRPLRVYTDPDNCEDIRKTRYSKIAIVELLVLAGADANVSDSYGRDVMEAALSLFDREICLCSRDTESLEYLSLEYLHTSGPGASAGAPLAPLGPPHQVSMFAPMVRLLRVHGAKMQRDVSHLLPTEPEYHWMVDLFLGETDKMDTKSQTLMNLCRFAIRGQMAELCTLHCVHKLALPDHLRRYVDIEYV